MSTRNRCGPTGCVCARVMVQLINLGAGDAPLPLWVVRHAFARPFARCHAVRESILPVAAVGCACAAARLVTGEWRAIKVLEHAVPVRENVICKAAARMAKSASMHPCGCASCRAHGAESRVCWHGLAVPAKHAQLNVSCRVNSRVVLDPGPQGRKGEGVDYPVSVSASASASVALALALGGSSPLSWW